MTFENIKYLEPLMLLMALAGHRWLLSLFRQHIKVKGGPVFRLLLIVLLLPVVKLTVDWVQLQQDQKVPLWTQMNQVLLGYCMAIFLGVIGACVGLLSNRFIFKKSDS